MRRKPDALIARAADDKVARRAQANSRVGIVNVAARGMLVVSVARRLGSEGPLLAYCAAALTERGRKKAPWVR